MFYRQIPPPAQLKNHVRYFWTLVGDSQSSNRLGPLVDGCPGIVFQRKELGVYSDHQQYQLPEFFLYGQTLTRTHIYLEGSFDTIGVCLFPNALKSIFGMDAHELTDSCVDFRLLPNRRDAFPADRFLNATSGDEQINILSEYLFSLLERSNYCVNALSQEAMIRISQSNGQIPLSQLQKELNLTERSLERRFKNEIGISPKLFSRIVRFQSAIQQLQHNRYAKLSDIAYDHGYTDQAHFIKSFKEFSGMLPHEFQKQFNQASEQIALQ